MNVACVNIEGGKLSETFVRPVIIVKKRPDICSYGEKLVYLHFIIVYKF